MLACENKCTDVLGRGWIHTHFLCDLVMLSGNSMYLTGGGAGGGGGVGFGTH